MTCTLCNCQLDMHTTTLLAASQEASLVNSTHNKSPCIPSQTAVLSTPTSTTTAVAATTMITTRVGSTGAIAATTEVYELPPIQILADCWNTATTTGCRSWCRSNTCYCHICSGHSIASAQVCSCPHIGKVSGVTMWLIVCLGWQICSGDGSYSMHSSCMLLCHRHSCC